MRSEVLIDKQKIGAINFEAHIIMDEKNLRAFAVYFENNDKPLLFFQQNIPSEKIEITINQELVNKLQQYKSKDDSVRKEHFKEFQTFVLESEQKAKELVFKDKKLKYISDVALIKSIEQAYITD